jgi:hypothetical protein
MVITSTVLSFDQADRLIRNFIDSTISARHLQDLTAEIGAELTRLRDKQTKEYRDRPLNTKPLQAQPPMKLAAVMVDGGRMRTRTTPSPSGVHNPHWRETKAAVLLRMTDVATGEDPHPDIPQCFASPMKSSEKRDTKRPERSATITKNALTKPEEPAPRSSPEPILRTSLASLTLLQCRSPVDPVRGYGRYRSSHEQLVVLHSVKAKHELLAVCFMSGGRPLSKLRIVSVRDSGRGDQLDYTN